MVDAEDQKVRKRNEMVETRSELFRTPSVERYFRYPLENVTCENPVKPKIKSLQNSRDKVAENCCVTKLK